MLAQHSLGSLKPKIERRARTRTRVYKHVKILFNDDKSVYDAMLKNVTAYGATLTVVSSETLPNAFNLQFVADEITVPCQVRWRKTDAVGVAF